MIVLRWRGRHFFQAYRRSATPSASIPNLVFGGHSPHHCERPGGGHRDARAPSCPPQVSSIGGMRDCPVACAQPVACAARSTIMFGGTGGLLSDAVLFAAGFIAAAPAIILWRSRFKDPGRLHRGNSRVRCFCCQHPCYASLYRRSGIFFKSAALHPISPFAESVR
jgi:hypothetical protein